VVGDTVGDTVGEAVGPEVHSPHVCGHVVWTFT
jgi:hypothetical protein